MPLASAGPYAYNLHFASDRNHANTPSLSFYRLDALPGSQPSVYAWINLADYAVVYWWFDVIDTDDIEAWELEEFLEDILNAEFNLVRDADNDGTDVSSVGVDALF